MVSRIAHRDKESGQQEAEDVHDPQELGARGPEVQGELLDRQLNYSYVYGVEQASKAITASPIHSLRLAFGALSTGMILS